MQLFLDRLPRKPYCTDNLTSGLVIRSRSIALEKPYIQYNPPVHTQALVFDIDRPLAECAAAYAEVAPPNFAVTDRHNGRGHLIYVLEAPVVHVPEYPRPLAYAAAVELEYCRRMAADPGYAGLITKNPLSARWRTIEHRANPYGLSELAEWVSLKSPNWVASGVRGEIVGLGRNCTLFENLRVWSYSAVRQYWNARDETAFRAAVLNKAINLNTFPAALQLSEVGHIASSVARWVWKEFTPQKFRLIQSCRSAKAADRRAEEADGRALTVQELRRLGRSDSEIAEQLGMHRSTVYRLRQRSV